MAVYEAAISTTIKVKYLHGWWINKFLNKMSSILYRPERKSNVWWFKSPITLAFKLDWGNSSCRTLVATQKVC